MGECSYPVKFFDYMAVPKDKLFECKRCGVKFYPPIWFFEGLCGDCFKLFDIEKMTGRFGDSPRCENSDVWVMDNPIRGKQ